MHLTQHALCVLSAAAGSQLLGRPTSSAVSKFQSFKKFQRMQRFALLKIPCLPFLWDPWIDSRESKNLDGKKQKLHSLTSNRKLA